ncbi:MAG: hypothetical protein JO154_16005 [Chitinophaga sp.]|uniref:LIC_13387 family protein n=1 Tax=Chitinophaga sp. TaxID=1869181 RepID=UPI0025C4B6C5|nr:hypothetical protein [Chitinophaga sp.]MBV8254108.1 hypothetical protein [Chitinophaga sp.]
MITQYFWGIGSAIIGLMGLSHVRATLFSNKLYPRDEKLIPEMEDSSLLLTDKANMWKAWLGFNATHGSGAAFIGIVNLYLAINGFTFLKSSQFLLLLTILTMGFYVWVARKYWFKIVMVMLMVSWTFFIASYILMMMQ